MREPIQVCEFTVYADQVRGKGRPRFGIRNGRPQAFNSSEDKAWERLIRNAYLAHSGGKDMALFADEVHICILIARKLPDSRPKRVEEESDVFKPDIDNICKSVLDALNGVAFRDDRQITVLHAEKWPRTRRGNELLTVRIEYFAGIEKVRHGRN